MIAAARGLLLIVTLAIGCEAAANGGNPVKNLAEDVRGGEVASISVLALPYDLRTRARVTPEILRESAASRELDMTQELADSLLRALDATEASPIDAEIDLRWGLILRDKAGRERHTIYLSGKSMFHAGRRGLIDEQAVKLNDPLVEWFETNFGSLQAQQ
jgi:hypothetical protein